MEVTVKSGEFTASQIDGSKYDVYEIFARFGNWQLKAYRKNGAERVLISEEERPQICKCDFSVNLNGEKIKFDYAYIMQHGTPGENGLMQGYLEMLGIPHSGCNAFVAAMTFDKFSCKSYLKDVDFVKCAEDIFIRKGESVSEGNMLLAEAAIVGRELTCAVYFNGVENVTLPVIEIITENEFFDYEAKYHGLSREVCPAEISDSLRDKIQEVSKKIYTHLGCSGLVRVDYICSGEDLYFLEVNTIPGMTSASLVPQMVRAAGLSMTDFLTTVIENS